MKKRSGEEPRFRARTRERLALALMGMAALPVLLIGALSYDYARNSLQDRLHNNLNAVLDLKQREISRWYEIVVSDTLLLGDNYLNEEHITVLLDPQADPVHQEAFSLFLTENLLSLQHARDGYIEIFYVDRSGNILLSTDPGRAGGNVADWEVVKQTFASANGAYVQDMVRTNGGTEMALGQVMHQVDLQAMTTTDLVNAAVIIRVNLEDSLYPIVMDWPARGETGEIYLIKELNGLPYYASPLRFRSDSALSVQVPEAVQADLESQMRSPAEDIISERNDYRDIEAVAGYNSIPELGWGLVIKQDRSEAIGPIIALRNIWILVTAVVLLAAFLFATWLSRSLTTPLNQLIQATRRVEAGDLDTQVVVQRSDEFGELGNAFNRMMSAVGRNAERIEQHSQELQALVNLSDTFLASVDVRQTLESAIRETMRATHTELGGAFMMLEGGTEFQTVAQVNLPDQLMDVKYPLDAHSSPGYAMLQRMTIYSPDLSQETRFSVPPALIKQGVASNVSAPMLIDGRTIGAITVASHQLREYSAQEVNMAQAIANHTAVALERIKLINDLSDSYDRTLGALATALDTRDRETEGHSKRVVAYTLTLATKMGVPIEDLQDIGRGALLHDIGKIGVPDSILHKTGRLSEGDWAIVRKHPEWGKQILGGIRFLDGPATMVLAHHERWDGSGYPLGLKGTEIPLGARIFAVVDAFDAITSYRPYRNPESYEKARAEIRKAAGAQFDPKVVDAFLKFGKEDWMHLREEVMGETSLDGASLKDMGSLRRIGSGQLQAMNVIISAITSSLDMNEVLERTVQKLVDVTRAVGAGIYLYDFDIEGLSYAAGVGLPEELKASGPVLAEEGVPNQEMLQQGISHFSEELAGTEDAALIRLHKLDPKWGSYLSVPLVAGDKVAGALIVFSGSGHVFNADERNLFEQAGRQIGQAIVNARLHEKVRHQAITDKLTGAYNRHYLDDFLNIEVKRCQRYQRPMAIVLLDLDHFKMCNERGGHQAGDKALRDVVQLLNLGVRSVDLVARYGGEEFLVVLPETEAEGAMEVAERMRRLIEKHHFPCGELTGSVGVATSLYRDGDTPGAEELIGRADKALFKAKQAGRNRVELWGRKGGT